MDQGKKQVVIIAAITGLCVLGDAMLFVVLPIYWKEMGLTAIWQIGVLLSVNRFIRLPLNPLVGWYYQHFSKRSGILIAVIIAAITTFSYGWLQGFVPLVIMRCLWGVAWSFLRLGGYLTIIDVAGKSRLGKYLGTYNGLWGLGGLLGMLAGGILTDIIGLQSVTLIFTVLAVLTFPFAWRYVPRQAAQETKNFIEEEATDATPKADASADGASEVGVIETKQESFGIKEKVPQSAHTGDLKPRFWLNPQVIFALLTGLVMAMVIFGIFASTLSTLLDQRLHAGLVVGTFVFGAASLAGILQALRWSWEPFLAPRVGALADLGHGRKLLILALLGTAGMLAVIAFDLPIYILLCGLLVLQFFSTIMVTAADFIASQVAQRTAKVKMMTAYTVAVDLGAALGPMLGYLVLTFAGLAELYWVTSIILIGLALYWVFKK